ncbi:conserved hypothetical protein [Cupriavidus phytorum]|uniref:Tyrosine specific protein phosphatases domain-containing protein n=1 Tax=Cupriavidus taiwanensis TaxID=164546 RepID=A0A976AA54_9BURK|nr:MULTISPECIES: hypothetical protein [Cupriavidus]SOY71778.1 conserved hypothetical protein [Cupriavidus taiwanensis]
MTPRLKTAIAKLYRHRLGGVRQVLALSRAEAERLPRVAWVGLISITAPGRAPARLEGFEHVLRLSFADVDFHSNTLSPRALARLDDAFTVEQANAVRLFVDSLPSSITTIVIHCEGGFSRSCAVTLALHWLYGYQVDLERLTQANPSVLRVMTGNAPLRREARRGRA